MRLPGLFVGARLGIRQLLPLRRLLPRATACAPAALGALVFSSGRTPKLAKASRACYTRGAMKFHRPDQRSYPPLVVGSVSDWDTWRSLCDPGAQPDCDVIELRVDALPESLSADDILAQRPALPVLLTLRHEAEGGRRRNWAEADRIRLALDLLPLATLLDWEIARLKGAEELVSEAKARGITLIGSGHDFRFTPAVSTLLALEDRGRKAGIDVAKFAFRINCAEDLPVGCELLEAARGPMALMGMGELGPTSRLLYAQMGSCLIYGYLGNTPAAPGQWPAAEFRRALGMLSAFDD